MQSDVIVCHSTSSSWIHLSRPLTRMKPSQKRHQVHVNAIKSRQFPIRLACPLFAHLTPFLCLSWTSPISVGSNAGSGIVDECSTLATHPARTGSSGAFAERNSTPGTPVLGMPGLTHELLTSLANVQPIERGEHFLRLGMNEDNVPCIFYQPLKPNTPFFSELRTSEVAKYIEVSRDDTRSISPKFIARKNPTCDLFKVAGAEDVPAHVALTFKRKFAYNHLLPSLDTSAPSSSTTKQVREITLHPWLGSHTGGCCSVYNAFL